jgi:cysteine desulfurase
MPPPVVYMDHNATTPVEPRVLERMLPYFTEKFGNAASRSHPYGWQAEEAVEQARRDIAALIGADTQELVLTSGATEANNLAILGVTEALAAKGRHVVTQATEHKAVLDTCKALERRGGEVTVLPVDHVGRVDPEAVRAALRPDTVLVSVMAANNEIGTLQPLDAIGAVCRERGVLLHVDAAQAAGRVPIDVRATGIHLLSLSAHKMYGPKGVGALYVRRRDPRVVLVAQMHGGGHERGRRSGTLNVPGVVGFGAAAALARSEGAAEGQRLTRLTERLYHLISTGLSGVALNGPPVAERLPGNLSVAFDGLEADALLMSVRGVALSSGAACTSATLEPSHVLAALGVSPERAHGTVRFGLGRLNDDAQIEAAATELIANVLKLRQLSRRSTPGPQPRELARGAR